MYGHAYRFMYVHAEELKDKTFIDKTKRRFKLTDIEYRSIESDVVAARSAENTRKEAKTATRARLISHIADVRLKCNTTTTRKNKKVRQTRREAFKGIQKIQHQSNEITNNPVFGSRKLLREISHLSNVVNNTTDKEQLEAMQLLEDKRLKYKEQRRGNIFVMGEANQTANRFFKFDFENDKIVYKPNAKTRVTFDILIPKNHKKELLQLQSLIDVKEIPVTVMVTKNTVNFTFDNEKLNGFALNEKKRRAEVIVIKKQNLPETEQKQRIKDVYVKYYKERDERKLKDKIEGRVMSVDMNPTALGYAIFDKGGKVIDCGTFDFGLLHIRTKTSSDSTEAKYAVNKRHYEKHNAIKRLFEIAKHYKCATFVMEDLDFKESNTKKSTSFNYETKVVWNRGLLEAAILKRCENEGIELKKVNPVYTSFIGNVMYEVYDPVAASIEIGRRGMKDSTFFPLITESIIDTVRSFTRDFDGKTIADVLLEKGCNMENGEDKITWSSMYYVSAGFGVPNQAFRVRRTKEVGLLQSFSVKNIKSKVVQSMYYTKIL
jgi:IS605 OrfB family transposase